MVGTAIKWTDQCLLVGLWWTVSWIVCGDAMGLPNGVLFALFSLFAAAIICGHIAELFHLPSLLGMLLAGFVMRNASEARSNVYIVDADWSSTIRNFALLIILLRAGLGLDIDNLRKMSTSVIRLACLPNIAEAVVDACLAVALFGMPWTFAFMLGFIMSAVSPAVVVPSLLRLKEQHYGTKKAIPDLVLAAASFDDVLSISGFGICLGLAFSNSSGGGSGGLIFNIFRGPLELVAGIVGGIVFGYICVFLSPNPPEYEKVENKEYCEGGLDQEDQEVRMSVNTYAPKEEVSDDVSVFRSLLLVGFSGFAIFGGKKVHFTGAGALAIIVLGIVAKRGWCTTEKGDSGVAQVEGLLKIIWTTFAQPLLFVLIGASVSITFIDGRFIGRGVTVLTVGLLVRLSVSMACVWYPTDQFELKEKVFIAMSWLPKATVQAALGAVALDRANDLSGSDNAGGENNDDGDKADKVLYGTQILTLAVLSILITAPLGAFLIARWGPKLLEQEKEKVKEKEKKEENELETDIGKQEEKEKDEENENENENEKDMIKNIEIA